MPPMMPWRRKQTSRHEDDSQHELPRGAELQRALQEILEEEPQRRARERAEERAAPADHRLHDELARRCRT
jgi:hypothetical protein